MNNKALSRFLSHMMSEVEDMHDLRFAARLAGLDVERRGKSRVSLTWRKTGTPCMSNAAWDEALAIIESVLRDGGRR